MVWCVRLQTETQIFAPTTGGAEKMAADFGVPFLGRIPLDPQLARACDEGQSYVDRCPDSAGAKAFHGVFNRTLVLSHVYFLVLCIAAAGVGD